MDAATVARLMLEGEALPLGDIIVRDGPIALERLAPREGGTA